MEKLPQSRGDFGDMRTKYDMLSHIEMVLVEKLMKLVW
jgi:hypothetical protein